LDISKEKIEKENKTSFMENVLMLMIAQIVIKILGFIYKIVIINVKGFGDVGNGYYNAGYQIYALLLTLSSVGVPSAVAKLVSERKAIGDIKGADKIFKISLKLFTSIGAILSILLFLLAPVIADKVLNVPDVKYTIMVLAPAIAFVAVSSVIRGYFAGLGTMKATVFSQTIEQFFNCVLTITFVYSLIGKSSAIMAAGGNLSTTLAVIIAFYYLWIFYKRRKKSIALECKKQTVEIENKTTKQLIKIILMISIPLTIGSLMSVINSTIDTITISNGIQKAYEGIIIGKAALEQKAMEMAGVLAKIETIIHLPLAINAAFAIALVPAISSAIAKKDYSQAKKRLSFSFFATMLIIMPCAFGLTALAGPILKMIYPLASEGALILQLTTITMIIVALNYVINGALYGMGRTYVPVVGLVIGGIVKLILNIILISNPNINIYGATISSIVCQAIVLIICTVIMQKHIKFKVNTKNHIIKPVVLSIIMGICVYFIYELSHKIFSNTISTLIGMFSGVLIYAVLIIFTKTLSRR
jgi:stage V sporulation protein B